MKISNRIIFITSAAAGFALAVEPKFEHETIAEIEIGYGINIADVDGDGKDDIVLADKRDIAWFKNPSWEKYVIADKLTLRDNVCVAARDLDGDGKCEIAVGANWNPGNTVDEKESGSVHYLVAPEDRTQRWEVVTLEHEPTVHRMHWRRLGAKWELVVLPLHGRGNKGGEGENGVRILGYAFPKDPSKAENWTTRLIDESLHKTHNFDVGWSERGTESMLIGGGEGLLWTANRKGEPELTVKAADFDSPGAGEVRFGPNYTFRGSYLKHLAAIEPLHGNEVVVYSVVKETSPVHKPVWKRTVIDDSLAQGHALACGDLLGLDREQIVAGWRNPDANGRVGVKLYTWNAADNSWTTHLIDDNEMATEDLKVNDLDGDGKLDVIAAGRKTQNLKVYWNKSELGKKPKLAGGWKKHVVWEGASCPSANAADFNGDGKIDIAFSAANKNHLLLAPDWKHIVIHDKNGGIHGTNMDVDGDGDPDYIGGNRHVYWLENPGGDRLEEGDWIYRAVDTDITGVHCVLEADVNQDGKIDLIANEFNPDSPVGNSMMWFETPGDVDAPWKRHIFADGDAAGGSHYMGMGDLDGDGDNDISAGAKGKPFLNGNWFAWWENTGKPNKWKRHDLALEQTAATCTVPGDFDGDGDMDIFATRGHDAGILWFENKGNKKFEMHMLDPLLSGAHCLTVNDLDGDGDLDAATTAKDDFRTVWFENDGKGNFTSHDIDDDQAAYDIRSVDIDGDGDIDLLVAGQASQNVVWYENL